MWRISIDKSSIAVVFLAGLSSFFVATATQAYVAVNNNLDTLAETFVIDQSLDTEYLYLGELNEAPELYELTLTQEQTVTVSLRVSADTDIEMMQPALLFVGYDDEVGIGEVVRLDFEVAQWIENTDASSKLKYLSAEPLVLDLTPGKYRIEVSSGSNLGKYMLVIGSDAKKESFGTTYKTVKVLYDFYDAPSILMLRTQVVSFPFGFVVLLVLAGVTWRYRRRLQIK